MTTAIIATKCINNTTHNNNSTNITFAINLPFPFLDSFLSHSKESLLVLIHYPYVLLSFCFILSFLQSAFPVHSLSLPSLPLPSTFSICHFLPFSQSPSFPSSHLPPFHPFSLPPLPNSHLRVVKSVTTTSSFFPDNQVGARGMGGGGGDLTCPRPSPCPSRIRPNTYLSATPSRLIMLSWLRPK